MRTQTDDPVAARKASITRVMDVPAKYLFLAHSRPEYLKRWFGPVGWPVTHCECDFRVGGAWRMIMTGPDGAEGPPFGGIYHEIVPYARIVYDDAFEDGKGGGMNLKHGGKILFTTTFDESGGRTTVTTVIRFASAAMKAEYLGIGMLEGLASGFDQLEGVARDLSRQA
jgi:uncharacterized protein YndB with AHSA1/START domain